MYIAREEAHNILTGYLGADLRNAFNGMPRWFTPGQERTIELDVLISASYVGGATEILEYFEEPDTFKAMVSDIFPAIAGRFDVSPHTTARQLNVQFVPGSGVIIPWSRTVFDILWTATRIGKVIGLKRLTVDAFVSALATADEQLSRLEQTRHIRLKGYMPRLDS